MSFVARITLIAIVIALGACAKTTDEDQLRAVVDAAEKAAEARDTSDVMAIVADDYGDTQGLDKEQLQNFLRGYFITHPKVELIVRIGNIRIETASRARVQLELVMVGTVGTADDSALTGNTESLEVDFRKIDGKWLAVRMERKRP